MWTLYPALQLASKDRAEHAREAARLRAVAETVTTPVARAHLLAKAKEHGQLAAFQEAKAAEADL